MLKTLREKCKMIKTSAQKTALLKPCIKEDVSSQGETKRYLVSLCETRFVERYVSIPVKHSKLGAKNFDKVCPKAVQNALKWPLQYVNFQNFSGGDFSNFSPPPIENPCYAYALIVCLVTLVISLNYGRLLVGN